MSSRYSTLVSRKTLYLLSNTSNAHLDDTKSLDSLYNETINIDGRLYQQLALEKRLSFSPIDEVTGLICRRIVQRSCIDKAFSRMSGRGWTGSMHFSRKRSTRGLYFRRSRIQNIFWTVVTGLLLGLARLPNDTHSARCVFLNVWMH